MASELFATIAGIDVDGIENTGFVDPPEMQGEFARGDDGSAQNSLRTPKLNFSFVGSFNPPSKYTEILTAISATGQLGVPIPVTVTSPADGLTLGATITAYVTLGKAPFKSWQGGTLKTTKITAPVAVREA